MLKKLIMLNEYHFFPFPSRSFGTQLKAMTERERILRRVALKCADFARQLSYHRALEEHDKDFKQNFWIVMYNNSIDLAVLDWFHLFGYHNDDLHWKQIVHDIDAF